jgi:hypothetical protein
MLVVQRRFIIACAAATCEVGVLAVASSLRVHGPLIHNPAQGDPEWVGFLQSDDAWRNWAGV